MLSTNNLVIHVTDKHEITVSIDREKSVKNKLEINQ